MFVTHFTTNVITVCFGGLGGLGGRTFRVYRERVQFPVYRKRSVLAGRLVQSPVTRRRFSGHRVAVFGQFTFLERTDTRETAGETFARASDVTNTRRFATYRSGWANHLCLTFIFSKKNVREYNGGASLYR
jgi:hypothetical protein